MQQRAAGWVIVAIGFLLAAIVTGGWLVMSSHQGADDPESSAAAAPSDSSSVEASPTASSGTTTAPAAVSSTVNGEEQACSNGATRVLFAAIRDIVDKGDVGTDYGRATRKYGEQSEVWRLASVMFPPVYAQMDANGAAAAKSTAETLVNDACARLHGTEADERASGIPDLSSAVPITVPGTTVEPSETRAAPTASVQRSCYSLEEVARPFSGDWLSVKDRGQFRDEVAMVQSQLNWLGYGCIAEDGDFGPQTESTVMRLQRDFGLVIDGVVGPKTWDALFFFH